ncbi:MAG: hypothetical protein WCJ56_12965, partial [bacterium]
MGEIQALGHGFAAGVGGVDAQGDAVDIILGEEPAHQVGECLRDDAVALELLAQPIAHLTVVVLVVD